MHTLAELLAKAPGTRRDPVSARLTWLLAKTYPHLDLAPVAEPAPRAENRGYCSGEFIRFVNTLIEAGERGASRAEIDAVFVEGLQWLRLALAREEKFWALDDAERSSRPPARARRLAPIRRHGASRSRRAGRPRVRSAARTASGSRGDPHRPGEDDPPGPRPGVHSSARKTRA